jgi:hypothetical protein
MQTPVPSARAGGVPIHSARLVALGPVPGYQHVPDLHQLPPRRAAVDLAPGHALTVTRRPLATAIRARPAMSMRSRLLGRVARTPRAPAKSRFVLICPMARVVGWASWDRVGLGREPDSSERRVRTFGADRDFAGALHPHPPAHPVNQLPLGPQRRPTRSLRGGQQRLQHRPLRVRQVEPPRHRCGVHEVSSGLRFFLVDEPLPENSLILDHRHAQPASPSCPLEPCGVRTYCAGDLAGSGLTLGAAWTLLETHRRGRSP